MQLCFVILGIFFITKTLSKQWLFIKKEKKQTNKNQSEFALLLL